MIMMIWGNVTLFRRETPISSWVVRADSSDVEEVEDRGAKLIKGDELAQRLFVMERLATELMRTDPRRQIADDRLDWAELQQRGKNDG